MGDSRTTQSLVYSRFSVFGVHLQIIVMYENVIWIKLKNGG